jgi:micrococcal nuclease
VSDDSCPRCGEPRIDALRRCRSCGLEFDGVQVAPEPPESQPPPGVRPPAKTRPIGRYVAVGIAAVLGLGLIGNLSGGASALPPATVPGPSVAVAATTTATARATTATNRASAAPSDSAGSGLRPDGPTVKAALVRVIDGDTIVAEVAGVQYHVRYIGMDTPESVKPGTPVQRMALEASAANKALVVGKTLLLEKDVSEVDRFGRLLRDVWVERDGKLVIVGLELVRTGFAQVTTFPPDVKYVDLLLAAQAAARDAGLGLWGDAANATPTPKADPPAALIGGNCHPSYSPCLPIVADLDCADVRAMGKAPVTVKGPDDYRLDGDGDGIGCR